MSATGTRIETKCRKALSKDGTYSPKLDPATAKRLIRYCVIADVNKAKSVCEAVNTWLDAKERKLLEEKSKEELIELLLGR